MSELPKPKDGDHAEETRQQFINRFMHDPVALKEYPKRIGREQAAIKVWDEKRMQNAECRMMNGKTDN